MKAFWLLLIAIVFLGSCQSKIIQRESPKSPEILLDHTYFLISYNPEHRLANWVSYSLSAAHLRQGVAKRRDRFFADPQLRAQNLPFARPQDFPGRLYDRGHLAPSEDFVWNQDANNETFVMSNMTPQSRKLNRGAWKVLESKVRKWACTEEDLRIIAGPILNAHLAKLPSQISLPQQFFKIVYDTTPPRKAIAFIYSQEDGRKTPEEAATSVMELEKSLGYEVLADPAEPKLSELKQQKNISQWKESDCIQKLR